MSNTQIMIKRNAYEQETRMQPSISVNTQENRDIETDSYIYIL